MNHLFAQAHARGVKGIVLYVWNDGQNKEDSINHVVEEKIVHVQSLSGETAQRLLYLLRQKAKLYQEQLFEDVEEGELIVRPLGRRERWKLIVCTSKMRDRYDILLSFQSGDPAEALVEPAIPPRVLTDAVRQRLTVAS